MNCMHEPEEPKPTEEKTPPVWDEEPVGNYDEEAEGALGDQWDE